MGYVWGRGLGVRASLSGFGFGRGLGGNYLVLWFLPWESLWIVWGSGAYLPGSVLGGLGGWLLLFYGCSGSCGSFFALVWLFSGRGGPCGLGFGFGRGLGGLVILVLWFFVLCFMGHFSPKSKALLALASPSEVYTAGKFHWHFTCGFNFRYSLRLPFLAVSSISKRLKAFIKSYY